MPQSRNFLHLYTRIYIHLEKIHFAYIVGTDVIQAFLINFLLIYRHIHIHHIVRARAKKTSQVLKAWNIRAWCPILYTFQCTLTISCCTFHETVEKNIIIYLLFICCIMTMIKAKHLTLTSLN